MEPVISWRRLLSQKDRPTTPLEEDVQGLTSDMPCEIWQRQRELNDHLALIRILDVPATKEDIRLFVVDPPLRTSRQRRQAMFDFVGYCLSESKAHPVAIATTIYAQDQLQQNQITLHIAGTCNYLRLAELLRFLKQTWQIPSQLQQQERVLVYMMQISERKLRKQMKKLRKIVLNQKEFVSAVDRWKKEELSPLVRNWDTGSPSKSLKCCFLELQTFCEAQDFDNPPFLSDTEARIKAYLQWFPCISALASTLFLEEVDIGPSQLPSRMVKSLRRLRHRCLKLRLYEIGTNLLCTVGRDTIWRILGQSGYSEFLNTADCESNSAPFRINQVEPPAILAPMSRQYPSPDGLVQAILSKIDGDEAGDGDEPYACDISDKPLTETCWTRTCAPSYHPEVQLVEYLRHHGLRPSPLYIGGSHLTCRACKWYIDRFVLSMRISSRTGGLDRRYLDVPLEWLIPPSEAGILCADFIADEAARLVLVEEDAQRAAWEAENQSEIEVKTSLFSFLDTIMSHAYNNRVILAAVKIRSS